MSPELDRLVRERRAGDLDGERLFSERLGELEALADRGDGRVGEPGADGERPDEALLVAARACQPLFEPGDARIALHLGRDAREELRRSLGDELEVERPFEEPDALLARLGVG